MPILNGSYQIYTINGSAFHETKPSNRTPLVLLHGWNAGVGYFVKNFDDLMKGRPVYAADVLGFGRSSPPSFDGFSDADVHLFYVRYLEDGVDQMGMDRVILAAHSF